MSIRRRAITSPLLWVATFGACTVAEEHNSADPVQHVMSAPAGPRPTPPLPDSAARERLATRQPGALALVEAEPVRGWTGPGGAPFSVTIRSAQPSSALFRRFGTIALPVALRERAPNLGQYPCTSCHLGRRIVMNDQRITDAHRNIDAVHPQQTGGLCSTCHSPANVQLLALESGEQASLDHTYRLCAQCHFAQADAWAGGAHGKRLDGWQGRRVVMGCADCHDPHKPGIGKRIPFRAPRLEPNREGHP